MKNTLFLLLLSTVGVLAQGSSWETRRVAEWNFEAAAEPLKNSLGKDPLKAPVTIRSAQGIAHLPAGVALKSGQLKGTSGELTTWMRFQIPPTYGDLKEISLLSDGNVQVKAMITTDNKGKEVAELSAVHDGQGTTPRPAIRIPVGLWAQVALTSHVNARGNRLYKFYYYAEHSSASNSDAKRNYWVYVGHLEVKETRNKAIRVGEDFPVISRSWMYVDEVRIYNKKAELQDLYGMLPVIPGFETFSPRVPGVVIEYSPAYTGRFVAGSPSVIVLEDGSYLAKGDHYGPAVGESELVTVFRSEDKGKTWNKISEVEGMTWASLFQVNGQVYMLGTSAGHKKGHAIIMRSGDKGLTWTRPRDKSTGIIFSDLSYHTAPTPVVIHNGQVWKAMEDEKGIGGWGTNFRAFMLHADVNSDLLNAESWKISDILPSDLNWEKGKFRGWLEGNAVLGPQGNMVNVLRLSITDGGGKAAIISYDKEGKKASFDPEKDIISFPGGSTKFFIRHDPPSGRYWALSNAVPAKHNGAAYSESLIRNTLVLMSSADLRNWEIEETVLYYPETAVHAFQYPTFALEGEDMLVVSRTAYDDAYGGAFKHHDVNYFTFHRIKNFRNKKLRKVE